MTEPRVPFLSRKRVLARLSELDTARTPHMGDWRNITNYIRPGRGKYLYSRQEESRRPTSLINSTPYIASRTLQAGMISGASSPAYQWFMFEYEDPDLGKWGPARIALEARQRIVYDILTDSNFYQSLQTIYGDSADFGTGMGLLQRHPKDLVSFRPLSPGEYYIDTDYSGDINTLYLDYEASVLQLCQRWPNQDAWPDTVKRAWEGKRYSEKVRVIETLETNTEFDADRSDWRGKPYTWTALTYAANGINEDGPGGFLEVGGYDDWPGPNLRWDVASGNKWGWGPGIVALGDSKALQAYEIRDAQAVDRAVSPPLQAPTSLRNKPLSHAPGGITYIDAFMGRAAIEPLYNISPGVLQAISAKIQAKEISINEVYYKDLFLMLATTDRREITAREVEEKHQEKLLALGPVVQRTHRDALDNSIIRIYNMAMKAGLFPPAPGELSESLVKIKYTSALAYAQRAAGAASIERFFGFMGNVVQAFPRVRHKINDFGFVNEYADSVGVPAIVMRSDKDAAAAATAEQQAAAAAQAPAQASEAASAAQLLSQTDLNRGSALDFIRERSGL